MFVLGFGIPVLVLYFGYKKVQTSGKRKAIMILNILLTVFTAFSLFNLIGLFLGAGILSSDGLKSIIEDSISSSDFDSTYISPDELLNTTMSIMTTVMWVVGIIDVIITAFGVFTNILGYKALADKVWTANANADAENKRIAAMSNPYGQPQPYQQTYNQSAAQNNYGQSPMQNSYGQTPVQNAYGQAPVQNAYGQAPVQNAYGQATQNNVQPVPQANGDWYCACGNRNTAGQKFCSNCGSANPNNN